MLRKIAAILILAAGAVFAYGQGEGSLRLVARGVDNGSMSPDGTSVLVQGADGILSIHDLQSGRSRKVLSGSVMISRLDPAGKRILMLASGAWKGADYYGLWIADVDGSGFRPFLAEPDRVAEDRYPLWSDDGKAVVWTRNGRLWTAAADGSGAKALTPAKKGSFIVPLDWMGDELLVSVSDDPYHAAIIKRLNLRTGATVDTGLRNGAAAFFGFADRVICYDDSLHVWDVAGRREERRVSWSRRPRSGIRSPDRRTLRATCSPPAIPWTPRSSIFSCSNGRASRPRRRAFRLTSTSMRQRSTIWFSPCGRLSRSPWPRSAASSRSRRAIPPTARLPSSGSTATGWPRAWLHTRTIRS